MTSARKLALAFAATRGIYAAALLAAPARIGTSWLGPDAERPAVRVAIRGLAARDGALSAGMAEAAVRGRPLLPWLLGSLAGDVTDLTATLLAGDAVPERSRRGTVALAGGSALVAAALAIGDA
jgi:hypothetical protein